MALKFCESAIFCILRELIFAIVEEWFFLLGASFCDLRESVAFNYQIFAFLNETTCNRVFSHDVTAAILVSQNNETAAMLVSQTSPVTVELFSYVNIITSLECELAS